ncbi:MAG: glycosyltransferase family 2 protein [Elainellaceae cyanobacterium]
MAPLNPDTVCALIPVYNEAATIASIVTALRTFGIEHIRVVDNGSTDDSAERAIAAGAEVLREPRRGYGQACWTGLQALPAEIEWVLFCDGDGSDDLSALPSMLSLCAQPHHIEPHLAGAVGSEALAAQNCDEGLADLVLGNRRATPQGQAALTLTQNFGNALATRLIEWGWGYRYHDLGPLRMIRRSCLDALQMRDRGFGWTVEMQVRAVEHHLRIREIPVAYFPRQGGQSKISGTLQGSFQAGTVILSTLGALYGQKIRAGIPHSPRRLPSPDSSLSLLSGLFILLGCIILIPHGDFQQEGVLEPFWLGYGVAGLGFILSWRITSLGGLWFWAIAILSRIFLLAMAPGDDIWRYLWEGLIQTQGFSPYDYAPIDPVLTPLRTEWWPLINRSDVSAIYPPLTQWIFRALAAIAPSVLLFKISITLADLAICRLLANRFGYVRSLTYAWNPLILYCFAGGGHYDSWFVLALVLAWLTFDRPGSASPSPRHYLISAFWTGISMALKWLSLPLLAFVVWKALRKLGWGVAALALVVGLLPVLITAFPYCYDGSCPLIPGGSGYVYGGRSADLIPEWVGWLWPASNRENWLFALPLAAWTGWLMLRAPSALVFSESYLIGLLALSPIVHSWYFTWLIPFAVATQNWGTRWLSLSAAVYFVLPYRQGLGRRNWALQDAEKALFWIPGVTGWLWSALRPGQRPKMPDD